MPKTADQLVRDYVAACSAADSRAIGCACIAMADYVRMNPKPPADGVIAHAVDILARYWAGTRWFAVDDRDCVRIHNAFQALRNHQPLGEKS